MAFSEYNLIVLIIRKRPYVAKTSVIDDLSDRFGFEMTRLAIVMNNSPLRLTHHEECTLTANSHSS